MKLLQRVAIAAAALGLIASAQAVPTLWLSTDGVTWTNVTIDNVSGDSNPAVGQATFIGSFGNFSLNVHTGTTFPAIGSLSNPAMDLSFNATASSAGNLYIAFSTNGFGPTLGVPSAAIGGTTSAGETVWYSTYGGNSNSLMDLSLLRTSIGPFTGPFSSSASGSAINSSLYSLTQVVRISATVGGQIATGDALLTVPDTSTTIILLGAGLMGLAVFGRTRKQFA
jgi:hypothetical protein